MIVDLKTVTEVVAVNPLDLIRTHQEEHEVNLDLTRVDLKLLVKLYLEISLHVSIVKSQNT